MHLLKFRLTFLLWLAPLTALQATSHSFWNNIQLHSSFCIKADSYTTHISGMHPGRQDGEMEINGAPINGTTIQAYRIRWHHAPSIYFERDKDKDDSEQIGYDPKGIFGFTGKGITLAAQLLASIDLYQLRIGAGTAIRCSFLKNMTGQWIGSKALHDDPNNETKGFSYIPEHGYYFTWTPLLRVGFKIVNSQYYTVLIDTTWAPCIYNFSELGKRGYWVYQRNLDLGSTWEKQLSRYLNWNLRLAYGFCLYNEFLEAYEPSSPDHLISVSHYTGGIVAQVGISLCMPGFNKCPVVGCHATLDHTHGGREYRGSGFFTDSW
ncbi:hypothetical protein [Cardinium endosymbiont of Philonthus spinipes]|uniref:hypothetical protein n=1 Tax=Cardinium endosymbiont of Philonthus spinipes TaxID=3077941 RepID=UPI00313D7EFB